MTVVAAGAFDPRSARARAGGRHQAGHDWQRSLGIALKRAIVQHLRGRGLAVLDVGTDERIR